ncbi:hypothetical protein QTG54_015464 [Skeletonema marinoi]|uniref:Uncharacterized protein n=1 Tax=Skeletonema marinoi TaxID=267567 RepID=A0AAD8XUG5_9STRA|nr:hypothetical protein QTG54_015464 [Skeletonema marinoi]
MQSLHNNIENNNTKASQEYQFVWRKMVRYTLFHDYITNGNATHFEVLREMQNLGVDDDRLLVPALFHLGIGMEEEDNYASLDRAGAVRMLELTNLLRRLRGHKYNVYECCFLAIGDLDKEVNLLCGAGFCMIAQILLLFILMYINMSDITNLTSWRKDGFTITVVFITTVFFIKLVLKQWSDACDFNAVFWKAGSGVNNVKRGLRKLLLGINVLINGALGIVVALFNIFFLLISENVNAAVINSLALFFILEMDDTLKPDWDQMYFDNSIALNVFRYIVAGKGSGDVQVETEADKVRARYLDLIQSDYKVHFKVQNPRRAGTLKKLVRFCLRSKKMLWWSCGEEERGQDFELMMFWMRNRLSVRFCISGKNGLDLIDVIKEFHCIKSEELPRSIDWCDLIDERHGDKKKGRNRWSYNDENDFRAVTVLVRNSGHEDNSATSFVATSISSLDAPSDEELSP